MAIGFGQTISYQDMFDNTVDKIVNMCVNVDKEIPANLQTGYQYNIGTFQGTPSGGSPNYFGLRGVVSDTSIVQRTRADVVENLNDFLNARGIGVSTMSGTDIKITVKAAINFFANVSSFMALHIKPF